MNTTQALHLCREARETYYALNRAWDKAKNIKDRRRLDRAATIAQFRWERRQIALNDLIEQESARG